MPKHPKQVDGLIVEPIDHELLIFNQSTGEGHALNDAAAAVFKLCDGNTDPAAMGAALADELGLPADGAWVDLALVELRDAGLITGGEAREGITRRSVIRMLGLTTMAAALLPVVETMVTQPAAAQTPSPSPSPSPNPSPSPRPSPSPAPSPTPSPTATPSPSPAPSPAPSPTGSPAPTSTPPAASKAAKAVVADPDATG